MPFWSRLYQITFAYASFFIRWPSPIVFQGENSLESVPNYAKKINPHIEKPWLLVTDQGIVKSGLFDRLTSLLKQQNIAYVAFDRVIPNPTIQSVEVATKLYLENQCRGIIAIGGGSVIDAAKGVGIRLVKPRKTFAQLRGLLKIGKKLPPLIAIPTTAGTGSEVTIAAVLSDPEKLEKFAIIDPNLIPRVAVLDPTLLVGLPSGMTSTTGMDALTHAIEAFIGFGPRFEKYKALKAIRLIHDNLVLSYQNPTDLSKRLAMLQASFLAGQAFTRDYVGNIHAMAHAFGAFYQIPHGLANAIIMPYVLKYYGQRIAPQLSLLHDLLNLGDKNQPSTTKVSTFINWIESLNQTMNIPTKIELKSLDHLDAMIDHALKEANPAYPVPVMFKDKDFRLLFKQVTRIIS